MLHPFHRRKLQERLDEVTARARGVDLPPRMDEAALPLDALEDAVHERDVARVTVHDERVDPAGQKRERFADVIGAA